MQVDHQRAALAAEPHRIGQEPQQPRFRFRIQLSWPCRRKSRTRRSTSGRSGSIRSSARQKALERLEWNRPDGRQQSRGHQRPGHGGPENRVAVVQQRVDARRRPCRGERPRRAASVASRRGRPGPRRWPGRPSGRAGRVPGAFAARDSLGGRLRAWARIFARTSCFQSCLRSGLLDGHLLGDAPDDLGMVGQGQKHGGGQVVAAADDQHGVGAGQAGQGRVGIGGLRLIDDHHADVFAGDAADGFAVRVGGAVGRAGRSDGPARGRLQWCV